MQRGTQHSTFIDGGRVLKKVFLQTQFGTPHKWTEQYFANFRMLERYGWYLKVFTPNPWDSVDNVEIIPMTLAKFDSLIEQQCGVVVGNYLKNGVPSKLVSDFYPAYGCILQDYIKDFDFWGFTNWDCVYGRLDHFVPDSLLETCDVWADDVNCINGIFTLMRNDTQTNNLFRFVPNWQRCFTIHEPYRFDEVRMTQTIRDLASTGKIRFKFPAYFPYHSYDRLVMHQPRPNLYFEPDGALIERLEDPGMPRDYICTPKGHYGREIMLFHFSRTKSWPIL
jgi:hypothetical protein